MKTIEEGEFFKINTENRMKGMEIVLQNLKNRKSWDKGHAVRKLRDEEIYRQKQDCKDFIKNLVKASNTEIVSSSQREISLTGNLVVTSK